MLGGALSDSHLSIVSSADSLRNSTNSNGNGCAMGGRLLVDGANSISNEMRSVGRGICCVMSAHHSVSGLSVLVTPISHVFYFCSCDN